MPTPSSSGNVILLAPETLASSIVVSSLGDSCVNITTKVWVKLADYWGVNYDLLENVKLSFDKHGISIPYPQTDVHLYQNQA